MTSLFVEAREELDMISLRIIRAFGEIRAAKNRGNVQASAAG